MAKSEYEVVSAADPSGFEVVSAPTATAAPDEFEVVSPPAAPLKAGTPEAEQLLADRRALGDQRRADLGLVPSADLPLTDTTMPPPAPVVQLNRPSGFVPNVTSPPKTTPGPAFTTPAEVVADPAASVAQKPESNQMLVNPSRVGPGPDPSMGSIRDAGKLMAGIDSVTPPTPAGLDTDDVVIDRTTSERLEAEAKLATESHILNMMKAGEKTDGMREQVLAGERARRGLIDPADPSIANNPFASPTGRTTDPLLRKQIPDVDTMTTDELHEYKKMVGGSTLNPLAGAIDAEIERRNVAPFVPVAQQRMNAGTLNAGQAPAPKDFFDALHETRENLVERLPFIGGAADAAYNLRVLSSLNRINSQDPNVSADDFSLVHDYLNKQREAQRDTTFGYMAANLVSHLPGFAAEFIATGGAFTAGKQAARKGVQKSLGEYVETKVGQQAVKWTGRAAGAAVQTTLNPGMIARNATERMMPQFHLDRNEAGELHAVIDKEGDDFPEALRKGFLDTYVEVASERTGHVLEKIPIPDRMKAMKAAIAGKWFATHPGKGVGAFQDVLRRAQWNGVVGEIFEEEVGKGGKAALGLEDYKLTTGKELLAQAVAFSVPGAANAITGKVQEKIGERAAERREDENFRRRLPAPGVEVQHGQGTRAAVTNDSDYEVVSTSTAQPEVAPRSEESRVVSSGRARETETPPTALEPSASAIPLRQPESLPGQSTPTRTESLPPGGESLVPPPAKVPTSPASVPSPDSTTVTPAANVRDDAAAGAESSPAARSGVAAPGADGAGTLPGEGSATAAQAATMGGYERTQENSATGPGGNLAPPVQTPLRGRLAGVEGRKGKLHFADGDSQPIQYVAVEADDLIPSHDARRAFAKNEGGDANERPYHDPIQGRDSRATVERIATTDDRIDLLLTDSPTATDGPPIIGPDGVVLGGNGRTMGVQLSYYRNNPTSASIRKATVEAAAKFGLDPAALAKMKNPIIVRRLDAPGERGAMSRTLNESLTTARTAATDAASRASKVSTGTAARVSKMLEPIGDEDAPSLRNVMAEPTKAATLVRSLVNDGAWTEADATRYTDPSTGALNNAGKLAIEDTLLGRIVDDPSTLGRMNGATRQRMMSALSPLTRGIADGEFKKALFNAVDSFNEFKSSGLTVNDFFFNQQTMTPHAGYGDGAAAAITSALDKMGPRQFRAAADVALDKLGMNDQGDRLGFAQVEKAASVEQAIREAFDPDGTVKATAKKAEAAKPAKNKPMPPHNIKPGTVNGHRYKSVAKVTKGKHKGVVGYGKTDAEARASLREMIAKREAGATQPAAAPQAESPAGEATTVSGGTAAAAPNTQTPRSNTAPAPTTATTQNPRLEAESIAKTGATAADTRASSTAENIPRQSSATLPQNQNPSASLPSPNSTDTTVSQGEGKAAQQDSAELPPPTAAKKPELPEGVTNEPPAGMADIVLIIKPLGIEMDVDSKIRQFVADNGGEIIDEWNGLVDAQRVAEHYRDSLPKPYGPPVVRYMAGRQATAFRVRMQADQIPTWRKKIGKSSVEPGSLRHELIGENWKPIFHEFRAVDNALHMSDSVEAGKREVTVWFGRPETLSTRESTQRVHAMLWHELKAISPSVRFGGSSYNGTHLPDELDDLDYVILAADMDAMRAKVAQIPGVTLETPNGRTDPTSGTTFYKYEYSWDEGKADIAVVDQEAYRWFIHQNALAKYFPQSWKDEFREKKQAAKQAVNVARARFGKDSPESKKAKAHYEAVKRDHYMQTRRYFGVKDLVKNRIDSYDFPLNTAVDDAAVRTMLDSVETRHGAEARALVQRAIDMLPAETRGHVIERAARFEIPEAPKDVAAAIEKVEDQPLAAPLETVLAPRIESIQETIIDTLGRLTAEGRGVKLEAHRDGLSTETPQNNLRDGDASRYRDFRIETADGMVSVTIPEMVVLHNGQAGAEIRRRINRANAAIESSKDDAKLVESLMDYAERLRIAASDLHYLGLEAQLASTSAMNLSTEIRIPLDAIQSSLTIGKPLTSARRGGANADALTTGTSGPPASSLTRKNDADSSTGSGKSESSSSSIPETSTNSIGQTPSESKENATKPAPAKPAGGALSNLSAEKQAKAEALRQKIRAKLATQLNVGLDPELFADGVQLGALYLESGAKKFSTFAQAMVRDLGDKIVPYLKAIYQGARYVPGVEAEDMSAPAFVHELTDDDIRRLVAGESTPAGTMEGANETPQEPADGSGNRDLQAVGDSNDERIGGDAGAQRPAVRGDAQDELSDRDADAQADAGLGGSERAGDAGRPTSDAGGPDVGQADAGAAGDARGTDEADGRRDGGEGSEGTARSSSAGLAPADRNHVIEPGDTIAPHGDRAKFDANLTAIKLVKQLQDENRNATPEEKKVLARYTGWGWIGNRFNEDHKEFDKWAGPVKELLTDEEWRQARASTTNAHYTSAEIIRPMWDLARQLGFKGGTVLEPGGGIGHFFGLMPQDLAAKSSLQGVELDKISADIMAKLYPQAEVTHAGYQDARISNNSVRLAISNVPFGDFTTGGKDYPKALLHDYFFLRTLDKLEPGGIAMFITSDGTLDKKTNAVRRLLAEKADLVGAIRLPNNAFKENAGTEVTTDILVFRKKDGTPFQGEPFLKLADVGEATVKDAKLGDVTTPIRANEYWAKHPEMVLGEHTLKGTMYAKDDYAAVAREGQDTPALLREAIKKLPKDIMGERPAAEQTNTGGKAEAGERELSNQIRDGKVWQVRDGKLVEPEWVTTKSTGKDPEERIPESLGEKRKLIATDWIGLRNATRALLDAENNQSSTPKTLAPLRKELNDVYEAYVKKWRTVNRRFAHTESAIFLQDDPDYTLVQGILENEEKSTDKKTGKEIVEYVKGDIFKKRIREPKAAPEHADSVNDAIAVSLAYHNKIDVAHVAKLLGVEEDAARGQILESGRAMLNPETGLFETTEKYLSGNVRKKLKAAEAAAETDTTYEKNVDALREIQPKPVTLDLVKFTFASRWVPPKAVEAFIKDVLKSDASVRYLRNVNAFFIEAANKGTPEITTTYGTADMNAIQLLQHALDGSEPVVKRTEGHGAERRTYVDKDATTAAKVKVQKLNDMFPKWARATEATVDVDGKQRTVNELLEASYNEINNAMVAPAYNGDYLTLPGITSVVRRYAHRLAMVARVLQDGFGVMAHGVGSGKTYTQIMSAMEMRRLGLAKKPMIVVQKATLGQFAASFRGAYPDARLMVADEKSFSARNRDRFLSRIAGGDFDAVIVTQPQFDALTSGRAGVLAYFNEQLDALEDAIREAAANGDGGRHKSPTQKNLEAAKKRLEAKLKRQLDRIEARGSQAVHFEDMGVDALLIDEAHAYKKIPIVTRKRNIKGIPADESQRAMNLAIKAKLVQDNNGGRNVILATGTPVTNTMAEVYVMLKLSAPQVLDEYQIGNFDDFANSYGESQTKPEFTVSGTWKNTTRFNKFINGPELVTMIRSAFDVKMGNKELGLDVPGMKGGKPELIKVPQTEESQRISDWIMAAGEQFDALDGRGRRENSWVPIVLMSTGTAAAVDPRLVEPGLPDNPKSKVNIAVAEVVKIHEETKKQRGTQLIFADRFKPMKTDLLRGFIGGVSNAPEIEDFSEEETEGAEEEVDAEGNTVDKEAEAQAKKEDDDYKAAGFNLYKDIKTKLIAAGIPENEVAIIHDFNTDKKREKLFEDVNAGKIRVLIGSTDKIGVGVNVQAKLVAAHHLDPPRMMTPAMLEQRDGRIIRQGNEFRDKDPGFEVWIKRYGLEKSMDIGIYQMLENKQKMIVQALSGKNIGREFEDAADEASMSMAEMKAALTGDDRVLRKVELDGQIRTLLAEQSAMESEVYAARKKAQYLRDRIETIGAVTLPRLTRSLEEITAATSAETLELKNSNRTLNDRKQIVAFLDQMLVDMKAEGAKAGPGGNIAKRRFTLNGIGVELSAFRRFVDTNIEPHVTFYDSRGGVLRYSDWTTGGGLLLSFKTIPRSVQSDINAATKERDDAVLQLPEVEKSAAREWEDQPKLNALVKQMEQLDKSLMGIVDKTGIVQRYGEITKGGRPSMFDRDNRDATGLPATAPTGVRRIAQLTPMFSGVPLPGTPAPRPDLLVPNDIVDRVLSSESAEVEARKHAATLVSPGFFHKAYQLTRRTLLESIPGRHYAFLNRSTDGKIIDTLRRLEAGREYGQAEAIGFLTDLLRDLNPDSYKVFTENVMLPDLLRNVEEGLYDGGQALPFGYEDADQIRRDLEKYKKIAEANPTIQKALEKRRQFMRDLSQKLVDADVLDAKVLKDDRYFHHVVITHAQAKLDQGRKPGGGKDAHSRTEGFQLGRKGSSADYLTAYHQAEFDFIAGAIGQLKRVEAQQRIKQAADITEVLKAEAKKANEVGAYGGLENWSRVQELRKRKRDTLTPEEKKDLDELDVFAPFRTQIAIANGQLLKMADNDELRVEDSRYDGLLHAMALAGGKGERFDHPLWFPFLKHLIDKDLPGAAPAMGVFKAIHDKEQFIQNALGRDYLDWNRADIDARTYLGRKDATGDTYVQWQPEPGNAMFSALTIAEEAAEKLIAGGGPLNRADLREAAIMAGKNETWVIPSRVAEQLNNLRPVNPPTTAVEQFFAAPNTAWKKWILFNPVRVLKYNINNMAGDLDIVLAYNPAILKEAPRAFADMVKHYRGLATAQDIREAIEGGVIGSALTVQELPELNNAPAFRYLTGESPTWWEATGGKYWETTTGLSQLREGVLRLAAYRWFKQQVAAGKNVYGASHPKEVAAISNVNERAAKLARELLGDYGALSPTGQKFRKFLIPFYSWLEVNAPRYARMLRNLLYEGNAGGRVARLGVSATLRTAALAGKFALGASLLTLMVTLYNRFFFPDEDKELGKEQRRQYLILGRTADGRIRYITLNGALADAMSWFGLEDAPTDVQEVRDGKATIGDKADDAWRATMSKFISGITPAIKVPAELLTGRKLYPNPTRPTPIRDPMEHVASTFSLVPLYRKVTGKPMPKGAGNFMLDSFIATADPGEISYYSTKSKEFDWLEKQGRSRGASDPSEKSNALFYYKLAVRFGDEEAADRYLNQYAALGGTPKGMRQSILLSAPGGAIPKAGRQAFYQTLSAEEKTTFDQAEKWYARTYGESQ